MDISIIIPASEKNKYSEKGDLSKWGSTSLLEWKISQIIKIKGISDIYHKQRLVPMGEYVPFSDIFNSLENYIYMESKIENQFLVLCPTF